MYFFNNQGLVIIAYILFLYSLKERNKINCSHKTNRTNGCKQTIQKVLGNKRNKDT